MVVFDEKKGAATFYFDLTQFNTNSGANPVTAADDIQFVLELRAGDEETYYPVFFDAYGSLNEEDAVRLADRVVNLEYVPADQVGKPFVGRQAIYFSGKESGMATNVRNQKGNVGPSADYPSPLLTTTTLWWGRTTPSPAGASASWTTRGPRPSARPSRRGAILSAPCRWCTTPCAWTRAS